MASCLKRTYETTANIKINISTPENKKTYVVCIFEYVINM